MSAAGIGRQTLKGALWLSGAGVAIAVANFGIFAVIARSIEPAELGLVSFEALCMELVRMALFAAVTDAVISRSDMDEAYVNTAFWVALAAGFAAFLACAALASPVVERIYGHQAGVILAALSIILLLEAPRCVQEGLFKRSFRYQAIAWRLSLATLGSGLLAVPLALAGWGPWALVAQRVAFSALQLLLSWRALGWSPGMQFSPDHAWDLGRYWSGASASRVLSQVGERAPEAVVGFVTGLEALAFYRVGSRALEAVSQLVLQPAAGVALSALARFEARERETQFLRMLRLVLVVAVPAYYGAGQVAPEFVQLLFGPRWAPSAEVMTVLAFAAAPTVVLALLASLVLASGKTRLLSKMSTFAVALISLAVLAGAFFGLTAAVVAQVMGAHAALYLSVRVLAAGLGCSERNIWRVVGPPVLAGLAMVLVLTPLRTFMADTPVLLRFALLCAVGAVSYGACLALATRDYAVGAWKDLDLLLPAGWRSGRS
ncbi:hypothetical protein SLNSH_14845 [Alsobacter soli]|uniref:Lipopolysaccharide biosynthesis protein n=1 Tax=Alsobacter soli TaxID=2109933 RepID=A0A2T1HRJ5_9HYPH|nr:oligosaccharide flippase family protein [Alsobacter soli]PSC04265.1 hypothetical protein SLNSH_14845 [Alsobacter soli]